MNTKKSIKLSEDRVQGIWEPEVCVKKNGITHTLRRKVLTTGTESVLVDLEKVAVLLRKGREVMLVGNADTKSGIRLYPCMDEGITEMFVASQTCGTFRKTLADIRFRVAHRGERISKTECAVINKSLSDRAEAAKREASCPVRVVQCPSCGYEFEIGGLKAK